MLLVIDCGNTNTLFAVYQDENLNKGIDEEKWVARWRAQTSAARTADEYAVWLAQLMDMRGLSFKDIRACVISSVVPQSLFNMRMLAERYLNVSPLVVGEADVKLGVKVDLPHPSEVGADRLVNAIGAYVKYQQALIIVDSGTATTFDIIGENGDFEGGVIAPGIDLSLRALHAAAAKLPHIAIKRPQKVIGRDTVEAMQSGVFWGYIGLIDGLVAKIKSEGKHDFRVICTGGVASLFVGASDAIESYDGNLTINGLYEIWRRNVN